MTMSCILLLDSLLPIDLETPSGAKNVVADKILPAYIELSKPVEFFMPSVKELSSIKEPIAAPIICP
jgi:hypothetical protein